jgi:hypothetical protein
MSSTSSSSSFSSISLSSSSSSSHSYIYQWDLTDECVAFYKCNDDISIGTNAILGINNNTEL